MRAEPAQPRRRARRSSSSPRRLRAVVNAFTGWNENVHMSEWAQLPTGSVGCARTERVRGVFDDDRAAGATARRSHGQARVVHGDERVARADDRVGSRFNVSGSMSTKPAVGADEAGAFALATNDSGDVSTRWPGPSPAATAAPCRAAVPLAKATTCAGARVVGKRLLEVVDLRPAWSASRYAEWQRPRRCRRRRSTGGRTGSRSFIRRRFSADLSA